MLKYVVILRVDKPKLWSQWHSGSTERYYKSPIFENEEEANKWRDEKLKEYPDSSINKYDYEKKYYINISVLAFDEEKSKDFQNFLNKWIPF